jgi:hypothetical protein
MRASLSIPGCQITVDCSDHWSATVQFADAESPHNVVIRAKAQEGADVLAQRLKAFLDLHLPNRAGQRAT